MDPTHVQPDDFLMVSHSLEQIVRQSDPLPDQEQTFIGQDMIPEMDGNVMGMIQDEINQAMDQLSEPAMPQEPEQQAYDPLMEDPWEMQKYMFDPLMQQFNPFMQPGPLGPPGPGFGPMPGPY